MTNTVIVLVCGAVSTASAVFAIVMATRSARAAKQAIKHARDAHGRTAAMRATARRKHTRGRL